MKYSILALLAFVAVSLSCSKPSNFHGPLRVSEDNPRYFCDDRGEAILLSGSHTWNNLVDMGPSDPPPSFDFEAHLQWLKSYGHNYTRLWAWELMNWNTAGNNPQNRSKEPEQHHVAPHIWQRSGPGLALDGKPKFDLNTYNPEYFQRLRSRLERAQELGICVSVMCFEGWGLQRSPNAYESHPFHPDNNLNGIDGDLNGDRLAVEIHELKDPAITEIQIRYLQKLIDTVNDLDNVLYEISNENHAASTDWQYAMIEAIKKYEQTMPQQHPVGMTFQFKGGTNADLFDSPADWISPNGKGGYRDNPPAADGSKVILTDTDHLWGIGGSSDWAWKSFCRGLNPIFMDPYDGLVLGIPFDQQWEPVRVSLGQILQYSRRLDLNRCLPRKDLASTGYCLANPGREYLVYLPEGGSVEVDTTAMKNSSAVVEWFNPLSGESSDLGRLEQVPNEFLSPFGKLPSILLIKAP